MVKLNQEHKSYSAAALNMEEQVMIRDDRGAKEETEITFDKVHTKLLNTQRMLRKAEDMGAREQKAAVAASQSFVRSKMESKRANDALKLAKKNYAAVEIQQKDAADLKARKEAGIAQTFLKMRNLVKERDARAAQGSVVDFKKADEEASKSCHENQRQMQESEFKIKRELTEEIGKKERAVAEKDIARMSADSDDNVNKENAANEQKLVAVAKAKADGNVADMMDVMSQDSMLGESKATAGAQAHRAVVEAALDKTKTKVATVNAALNAAKADSKASDHAVDLAQKASDAEKDEAKKKPLAQALESARQDAEEEAHKTAKLTKARTQAELDETRAKAAVAGAEADSDSA